MVKKRKIISIILTITTLSFILGGCTNSKEEVIEDENAIVIWVNSLDNQKEELTKLTQKWSLENNINVKVIENISGSGKDLAETADGLKPDIFWGINAEDTEMLYKTNTVSEVPKDLINKDNYISEDLIRGTSINNVQYGIPVVQENVLLFYNPDLVEKVPDTMEEVIDIAKDKGISYEFSNYYYSFGFIASQGGYIFKDNNGVYDANDLGVNNEGAVKGYNLINKLFIENKLFLGGVTDMIASNDFASGKVGFYIGEPGRIRTFNNSKANFKTAVIPTLKGETVTPLKYIKMAVVTKKSEKQDESWRLLKYLTESSDDIYMEMGPSAPIFKSSLESSVYKENENVQNLYKQSLQTMLLPNNIENGALDYAMPPSFEGLALEKINAEECGKSMEINLQSAIKELF